ncbi:MAG: DMT family transporter, partial [Myxococcota bacterium]|nr:DMT family transporter [Myxococcota bacterium]
MTRPVAVFLVGTFGIACAALFVRWALPAPPVVTAFWRIALAVALLAGWLALRGRSLRLPPGVLVPALAAGACFGLDMALWNTALVETSVADATFLVNTTPVWVGLHAVAVLREPPGSRFLAGAGLALAGTGLLLGDDLGRAASLRGDLLALGAGAFYSAY